MIANHSIIVVRDNVATFEDGEQIGAIHPICITSLFKAAPELLLVLQTLADNADEDCPDGCRTKHLSQALEDAYAAISKVTQP